MNRYRKQSPRLSLVLLGLIMAGTLQPHGARAQGLEENIDAELDGITDGASTPPAKPKADAKKAQKKEASGPMEEELLDEGGDDLEISDSLIIEKGGEQAAKPAEPPPPPAEEPPPPAPEVASSSFGDEPNLELEKRLARIFSRSEPISEAKWSELIGDRREESYGIQAGDTLWDISQTFFGDGMFWSKLWAENGAIENPHVITPGKGIRFIAGTESEAPSVDVTPTAVVASAKEIVSTNAFVESVGEAPVYADQAPRLSKKEIDEGETLEEDELIPRPVIPPPMQSKPPLKKLPASFVSSRTKFGGNYDSTGLDAPKQRVFTVPATILAESYIAEETPKGIGKIEEIELGESVASLGQIVYLKLDRKVAPGDRLYAIFPKGKVSDPDQGSVGPVVEVGGILEVISVMNAEKGIFKASVTYSVNPIRVGSVVTDETLPKASLAKTGPRSAVEVRVIGGEYDEARKLLGAGAVIYLNGGVKAGLREGDLLSVQARRGERREDTSFPDDKRPIALIKIIKALPTVATAVVLDAYDEIRPGDKTGGDFPKPSRQLKSEGPESGDGVAKAKDDDFEQPRRSDDPDSEDDLDL